MTALPNVAAFNWDSMPAEGDAQVARQSFASDGVCLRRVQVKAGATADRHSHPHEQIVLVLQGAGHLRCEAGTVALRPDTVIHLRSGDWHSAVFETDTVLLEVNLPPAH